MSAALKRHFGQDVARDYDHDPVNADHRLSEPPSLPDHARAVHGHFRADRYVACRRAFQFTFLRDLVAKLISTHFFWRRSSPRGSPTHDRFLDQRPSVLDFARYCWPLRRLMSMSYFGGVDINSLKFVDSYETSVRDLARLSKTLTISLAAETYQNRTPPDDERTALADDTKTPAALKSILADEVFFCEKVRERRGLMSS